MKVLAIVCLAVVAAQALPRHQLQDPIVNTEFYKRFFGNGVSDGADPKIVGGTEATPHEYPWQLNMIISGSYFCGAALIAPDAVLTAAHCVEGTVSSLEITAGDHDRRITESGQQVKQACNSIASCNSAITVHPDWDSSTLAGDLAVVKLSSPFQTSNTVKVIDLAANNPSASDQYNGKTMTVTGWGKTADGILVGTSNVLMEVDVVGITKAECARTYGTIITDNIVCVSTTGGHGTCNGDSGGPMILRNAGGQEEVGIVSFGSSAGCEKGLPAGFTRVSAYTNWIKQTAGML